MARSYKEVNVVIPAPMRGINMITSVDKLAVDEAVDVRGYEFQEYGVIGLPWSSVELGNIASGGDGKILSAHCFQREGETTQMLIHLDDGRLRYSDDFLTADVDTVATWTDIAVDLSETARFYFVTFLDNVYMSNGVDDYRRWDGAAEVTYPAVPKVKYLTVWRDCLWGADAPDEPHRVRNSEAGVGSSWPALNFVDIEKGGGLGITSLMAEANELVIFKYLSTFALYDPIEYYNRLVDTDKGSVSHFATISHDGRIYFMSHMGICVYTGDAPSEIVSARIAPVFDDLYRPTDTTETIRLWDVEPATWACSFEDHIDFRIPMRTDEEVDVSSSFQLYPGYPGGPWLRSGPDGSVFITVREKGLPAQQYDFNEGVMYRRYSDPDSIHAGVWYTSWQDLDSPTAEKYLHTVTVLARGPFDLLVFKDFDLLTSAYPETTSGHLNQGDTTEGSQLKDTRVYVDAYGRTFQIKVGVDSSSEEYVAANLTQYMSSGQGQPFPAHRLASGIARIILRARVLGEDY